MQVFPQPPSVTLEDPLPSPMFTWKASHSSWYLLIDKVLHVQSIPHGLMLQRKDKIVDIWYKRHKLYPQCLDVTSPSAWRSPAMLLQGTVLNRINWSDWIESSASIPAAAGPLIICLCGYRKQGGRSLNQPIPPRTDPLAHTPTWLCRQRAAEWEHGKWDGF